jgi:hypothetical protein
LGLSLQETGAFSLFRSIPRTIHLPANLTPYVRSGLIAEFASALDILEDAMAGEADHERWRVGLAQLDCARELLGAVGVTAGSGDFDIDLEVESPRAARMLLDALRAVYNVEVERLADARNDRVHIPLREVPVLRNFIVDVERQLDRAAKRQIPILDAFQKRTPRSVKFAG